jgi:hypothetical protein
MVKEWLNNLWKIEILKWISEGRYALIEASSVPSSLGEIIAPSTHDEAITPFLC